MKASLFSRSAESAGSTAMEPTKTIEAAIAASASKATYAGSGSVIMGFITSSEFTIIMGLVLAIGGFIVNWYYKAKDDRRLQAEHEVRMGMME